MKRQRKLWFVYILKVSDGSFYTGITNNLGRRLNAHKAGKGSKYVRSRLPFTLEYIELSLNRSYATKRELQIKRMSRAKKEELMEEVNISEWR